MFLTQGADGQYRYIFTFDDLRDLQRFLERLRVFLQGPDTLAGITGTEPVRTALAQASEIISRVHALWGNLDGEPDEPCSRRFVQHGDAVGMLWAVDRVLSGAVDSLAALWRSREDGPERDRLDDAGYELAGTVNGLRWITGQVSTIDNQMMTGDDR